MIPRPEEIRFSKKQQEIIMSNSIAATCPTCKRKVNIPKDTKVHCVHCLMKGTISELKPFEAHRKKSTRKSSKVTTYKLVENQTD